jgi:hypothetical protein
VAGGAEEETDLVSDKVNELKVDLVLEGGIGKESELRGEE